MYKGWLWKNVEVVEIEFLEGPNLKKENMSADFLWYIQTCQGSLKNGEQMWKISTTIKNPAIVVLLGDKLV